MSTTVTAESLLSLIKQSGLVDQDQLKKVLKELKDQGLSLEEPKAIADELVKRGTLTRWQADKILQGKHKGFFLGKYRLLSLLGTGGMSSVYLAEHVLMRRRVAIKVLPQARVEDTSYLQRFHREAQAVAALDHRNIVRAYDVDQEGKIHFLVMEYVGGKSLQELVAESGPLPFVAAAEYIRQAAEGLHAAHRAGMVHRDIKPGNVLIDDKGTVKLLDLGLARFFDEKEEASLTIKHDEKVLGTADYLAPEQALDSHSVDIRADIYSLGGTFYFILTGHPPFPEGTMAQRLMSHQTKTPAPIQADRADVPASLVAIVDRMMAKKPDDRYQTARDAAQALWQWLTENGGASWVRLNPMASGQSSVMTGSGVALLQSEPSPQPLAASGSAPQPDPATSQTGVAATAVGAAASTAIGVPAAAAVSDEDSQLAAFFSNAAPPQQAAPVAPAAPNIVWPQGVGAEEAPPGFASPFDFQAPRPAAVAQPAAPAVPVARPVAQAVPVAQPVYAVPVAAVAVAQPPLARPVGTPPPDAKGNLLGNKKVVISVTSGTLLLIVAILYAVFGSKGDGKATVAKKGDKSTKAKTTDSGGGTSAAPGPAPRSRELTVGPAGEFKTIAAALAQAKKNPQSKSRNAVQIIKVAGGTTYPERIVVDGSFPKGIQIEVAEGADATLAPTGSEAVVQITGTLENFRLEGFTIDAGNRETAIRVSEWISGLKLKRLKLNGFTKAGIVCDGTYALSSPRDRMVLERIDFRGGDPQAKGIVFRKGKEDPTNAFIHQCRFFGPLAAGIVCETQVQALDVVECIFSQLGVGTRFEGEKRVWKDIVHASNTFYQVDRGIVFTNMPESGTFGFGFYNNLFVGQKGPAVSVEKDFNETNFSGMYTTVGSGVLNNWTDLPAPAAPVANEVKILASNAGGGRYDVKDLQFASTDPSSADFLAPSSASPQRQSVSVNKKYPAWVGAVGPKK